MTVPFEYVAWFFGIAVALTVVGLLALFFGDRALKAVMRRRAALRKRIGPSDGP